MKPITSTLLILVLAFSSCESSNINTNSIIGKWKPYIDEPKQSNIDPLPVIEFTANGQYLVDGKGGGAMCCGLGNKYAIISKNTINFTESITCPAVRCATCSTLQMKQERGILTLTNNCRDNTSTKWIRIE